MGTRCRDDFCLLDPFGAVLWNHAVVTNLFTSTAVLWTCKLASKPSGLLVFDDEEERNKIEKVSGTMNQMTVMESLKIKKSAEALERQRNALLTRDKRINAQELLTTGTGRSLFDRTAVKKIALDTLMKSQAERTERLLLTNDAKSSHHTVDAETKRRRTTILAQQRRSHARRRFVALECIMHITLTFFTFFTSWLYNGVYAERRHLPAVYSNSLTWDITEHPDIASYFQAKIANNGMKRGIWSPREVRIRQWRVNCDSRSCPIYSPANQATSFPRNLSESNNPKFKFVHVNESVTSLSQGWDSASMLSSYAGDTGAFVMYWPDPVDKTAMPNFNQWIDNGTRAVFIEFNAFEKDSSLFLACKVVAQYAYFMRGALIPGGAQQCPVGLSDDSDPILPVILVRSAYNSDIFPEARLKTKQSMILCGFAIAFGFASILRGLGFLNLFISEDEDVANAVERYEPNLKLTQTAVTAVRVSLPNRSFRSNSRNRILWLFVDTCTFSLLLAGIIVNYVVVEPGSSKSLKCLDTNNSYVELYDWMQNRSVVVNLLAFAAMLSLFSLMRIVRLVASGLLLIDTVTRSVVPGLLVLYIFGYLPVLLSLAVISNLMFGYVHFEWQSFEIAVFSVASKYFDYDLVVNFVWKPVLTILTLGFYVTIESLAYGIIIYAFVQESSRKVKSTFSIYEILWPFPALHRRWGRMGKLSDDNDLWGETQSDVGTMEDQDVHVLPEDVGGRNSPRTNKSFLQKSFVERQKNVLREVNANERMENV